MYVQGYVYVSSAHVEWRKEGRKRKNGENKGTAGFV